MNDNTASTLFGDSNEDMPLPPPARQFPWKILLLVAGVVIVLGILAGGVWVAAPCLIDTPDKMLDDYYASFNALDFPKMSSFYTDTNTSQVLQTIGDLKSRAETALKVVAPNFKLAWELQSRTTEVLEKAIDHQCASAIIRVTGKLYVHDANGTLGITLGYDITHNLIRKDGRWYLKP